MESVYTPLCKNPAKCREDLNSVFQNSQILRPNGTKLNIDIKNLAARFVPRESIIDQRYDINCAVTVKYKLMSDIHCDVNYIHAVLVDAIFVERYIQGKSSIKSLAIIFLLLTYCLNY